MIVEVTPVPVVVAALVPALVKVQVPVVGKPFMITLPVAKAQVGCVIAPTVGAVGKALTVTGEVVLLQPVEVWVKVKVTLPAETPVTSPALVTVALVRSLLVHVPPVVGDKVIVLPTQTEDPALTDGKALTVTVAMAEHPELLV